MRNAEFFLNQKVAIVGLARSGFACANLLAGCGASVCVTEERDNEAVVSSAKELISKGIKVEWGRHTPAFIKGRDLVVISPGVSGQAQPVVWADEFHIPIVSEIEAAWQVSPATVIAVTGSSGKTTVTTLIGKLLEAAGRKVFVCGNIGNPFSGEVASIRLNDFVSLEVSSFQLERIKDFKPKVAVMLNFSRNHLDRYKDMPEYLAAKKRIFMNQDKDDFLVFNADDPVLTEAAGSCRAKCIPFSGRAGMNPNLAALSAVSEALGVEKKLAVQVFRDFKGIAHRLEHVALINKVTFINDSKATTAESASWALHSIASPVILIAGGKDKGVDYASILAAAKDKVKQVVAIGQAQDKIMQALGASFPVKSAGSLGEAVEQAYRAARPGDCVLLSPMCSSFDMFSGYEERGECFKKAVLNLR